MIKYRLIVGEIGNEQGHIVSTAARGFAGAKIALGRQLAKYGGDGWGRIEVNYHNGDPAMWFEPEREANCEYRRHSSSG